jgi:cbb3-type cytochrome oxidase maturation protein
MSALIVLVLIAFCMGLLAMGGFVWGVRDGQYDDLEAPPARLLLDSKQEWERHE